MCGNGAGAAVVTSLARYTLRAAAVHDPDPVAVLTELNAALHRERLEPAHRFCSVVFGVLAPDGRRLRRRPGHRRAPPARR